MINRNIVTLPADSSVKELLHEIVQEGASLHGAHLIDLVVRGDRRRRVIEVFVDAEKSVTLDQCSAISRTISAAIDGRTLLEGDYRLEVSSPGIDRPLIHPWQYPKHVGRTLRVTLRREGESVVREGILTAVGDTGIEIERPGTQAREVLSFIEIETALVRAPW